MASNNNRFAALDLPSPSASDDNTESNGNTPTAQDAEVDEGEKFSNQEEEEEATTDNDGDNEGDNKYDYHQPVTDQSNPYLFTYNEKGTIALTVQGVGARMMQANERGGALVALSSLLIGPRGPPSTAKFPRDSSRALRRARMTGNTQSKHLTREKLTTLMNDILIEAETLNTVEDYTNQLRDLILFMFHAGDILDGRGERQIFIWMMMNFITYSPELVYALVPFIPEYTCWRTLGTFFEQTKKESLTSRVLENNQLATDYARILNRIIDVWADQLCKDNESLRNYNERQKLIRQKQSNEGNHKDTHVLPSSTKSPTDGPTDNETETDQTNTDPSNTTGNTTKKKSKPKRYGPPLSLAGKWAPSIGKALDRSCFLGQELSRALYIRLPEEVRSMYKSVAKEPISSAASSSSSSSSSESESSATTNASTTTLTTTTTATQPVLVQQVAEPEKIPNEILQLLQAQQQGNNAIPSLVPSSSSSSSSTTTVPPPAKSSFSYASIAAKGAQQVKANVKAYNEAKAKAESDREVEREKERKEKAVADKEARRLAKREEKRAKRRPKKVNRLLLQTETENLAEKTYRKILGKLRESLQVVERFMCNDRWDEINPTSVPSLANNKYSDALLNRVGNRTKWPRDAGTYDYVHSGVDLTKIMSVHGNNARRTDNPKRMKLSKMVRDAAKASTETVVPEGITTEDYEKLRSAQIKGARLQPHEIVTKVMREIETVPFERSNVADLPPGVNGVPRYDDDDDNGAVGNTSSSSLSSSSSLVPEPPKANVLIEAMWADLIRSMKTKGRFSKPIVPLVDVSSSMLGLPMQVSIAMGLVVASLNDENLPWFGKAITFASNPTWFDLSAVLPCTSKNSNGTLYAAVEALKNMPWGGSTHFGKALRLLLDVMQTAQLPPEHAPSTLFVFSDMNFDIAAENENQLVDTTIDGVEPYVNRSPFSLAGEDMMAAFEQAGYPRPTVVLWNLRADGEPTFQSDASTPGVIMVSGFSTEIMRQICDEGVEAALQTFDAQKVEGSFATPSEDYSSYPVAPAVNSSPKVKPTPWEFIQKGIGAQRYDTIRQYLDGNDTNTTLTSTTVTGASISSDGTENKDNKSNVSSPSMDNIRKMVNIEKLMKEHQRFVNP